MTSANYNSQYHAITKRMKNSERDREAKKTGHATKQTLRGELRGRERKRGRAGKTWNPSKLR